jgi:Fe-S cluster biosynthesis and repair protein YggX
MSTYRLFAQFAAKSCFSPQILRRRAQIKTCLPLDQFPPLLRSIGAPACLTNKNPCYNIPMPRMVKCVKLGRELPGLNEPPFDTELGQKIYENVSAEAWKMWAEHSKMLLNEYRLQPWKPEAQQFLVDQMQEYFFGSGAQLPKEFVPPPK